MVCPNLTWREPQARALRERLEASGIRLWQDRAGMEGGRDS
jgi:hypothetical protein